jgi:hypothetical protein
MRGSIFYDVNRLQAVEAAKELVRHKQRLDKINSRLHSDIRNSYSDSSFHLHNNFAFSQVVGHTLRYQD